MGFLGGFARAATPAVTGLIQGQMAGKDRQRQQQMEALQAMLLQEKLNEIPMARKERSEDRAIGMDDRAIAQDDRMFNRKRQSRMDKRVPTQIVDRLGPDGQPGTFAVPEYGGPPIDTGLKPIPEPASGGGGGRGERPFAQSAMVDKDGNPLVFDSGRGVYYRPGAPGVAVRAFTKPTEQGYRLGGLTPSVDAAKAELAAMESPGAVEALVHRPPIIGNFITTETQQAYNNALKRYMLSVYLVSGQAFPEKEWDRLQGMFGYVAGDKAPRIQQKAQARELFVNGLLKMTPPQFRPGDGGGEAAPDNGAPPMTRQGKGVIPPAALEAARAEGYTDEEIVAQGWDLP